MYKCLVIVSGRTWSFTAVFRVLVCYGPGVVIVIAPLGVVLLVMYIMQLISNSSK